MGKDYWVTGFAVPLLMHFATLLFTSFYGRWEAGGNLFFKKKWQFVVTPFGIISGAYNEANVTFTPNHGTQMGMSTQLYDYGVYYASKRFNDPSTNRQVWVFISF